MDNLTSIGLICSAYPYYLFSHYLAQSVVNNEKKYYLCILKGGGCVLMWYLFFHTFCTQTIVFYRNIHIFRGKENQGADWI